MATVYPKNFYRLYGKRCLDIVLLCFLALPCALLLVPLALWIKWDSAGPIFYRQQRVGRGGKLFTLWKLRTMHSGALPTFFLKKGDPHLLPKEIFHWITVAEDRRISFCGRFLRRYKLDEIPQLWNIACAQMSFIGPRPEVPVYVALSPGMQQALESLCPGLSDWASLALLHEEKLLASQGQPERFYEEILLPLKAKQAQRYLQEISLIGDLYLLWQTFRVLCGLAVVHKEVLLLDNDRGKA